MPPVFLTPTASPTRPAPGLHSVELLPGRGMNVYQVRAVVPALGVTDLLASPPLDQAAAILSGGPGDEFGNQSFWLGGAMLAPFCGRIRGVPVGAQAIHAAVAGHRVLLPANWRGGQPDAERHAIHGLMLNRRADRVDRAPGGDLVTGLFDAGDFGVGWPSHLEIEVRVAATASLHVEIAASNAGSLPSPVGLGWHPYVAFPSGRREQVRLRVPARSRVAVNNADDVFPTGRLLTVSGTPHDLSPPGGTPLGDLFLNECYTDLERNASGHAVAEVLDPASGYAVRMTALSPQIRAFQVYSPPDRAYVALEPWFNLPDPFNPAWNGVDTGMVLLQPGESTSFAVRLELFVP